MAVRRAVERKTLLCQLDGPLVHGAPDAIQCRQSFFSCFLLVSPLLVDAVTPHPRLLRQSQTQAD